MIEVDIETMRQEGLQAFRDALVARVRSGVSPDTQFIQKALLKAMEPILKAIIGDDARPEDHIRIHVTPGKDESGQPSNFTQAEGLTQMGNMVIESFMDMKCDAEA